MRLNYSRFRQLIVNHTQQQNDVDRLSTIPHCASLSGFSIEAITFFSSTFCVFGCVGRSKCVYSFFMEKMENKET